MNNIYYDNIKIEPYDINKELDNTICFKLKEKIGNKCNVNGYVKKDTINILNKSIGKIISSHFDGSIYYRLEYTADVLNPNENDIINCNILKKNKHGILANNDCIYIVIPYVCNGNNNEDKFKNLNINDNIKIKVIGSYFEINDTQINVHGEFIEKL
tara:strand:- start:27 stop:497 length:471 start_codon:yes stop_codon:yes gene_type:complete